MSFETRDEEKSFEELFESYTRGMNENLRSGDKIRGKILSIGRETVYVETGTKIDGVVEKLELLDEKGELPYEVGDFLDLYVVSQGGDEIRLSRALSGKADLSLMEALEKRIPVEGKVKAECKGGFQVEVLKKRAFCPISQIDLRFVESPDEYVGKTFSFLVAQVEEGGRNIVVSRRELLLKEQERTKEAFLKELQVGSVRDGRVKKVMPYGAFVELVPGLEGMVHVSELSWSRVEDPEAFLKADDPVRVKVIGMGKGDAPNQMRIALSIKQTVNDPWEELEGKAAIGDRLTGTVTRCTNFGCFVEILEGVEGLVHVSEMTGKKWGAKASEIVTPGETVHVTVKEIDAARRRISLSMRDAEGDPWFRLGEKYRVGQKATGVIEKKEGFGCFVALEPGITGLLPKTNIARSGRGAAIEKLREGDRIPVAIAEIDADRRRITLDCADPGDEADWKSFVNDRGKPVSSLGEKLQQALRAKKK